MSDLFFRFGEVFRSPGARAARWAVLSRFASDIHDAASITKGTTALLARWRERITELTAAGFLRWQDPQHYRLARNCSPSFVQSNRRPWTCYSTGLCPFCYAREVTKIYEAAATSLDEALFAQVGHSPHWIVERTRSSVSHCDTAELLCDGLRHSGTGRRGAMLRFQALGGYAKSVVVPVAGQPDHWRCTVRQFFKVAAGTPVDVVHGEKIRIWTDITAKVLAGVVARVCRYPRELLTTADPAAVAFLFNAKAQFRVRTSALLGDFRGREKQGPPS